MDAVYHVSEREVISNSMKVVKVMAVHLYMYVCLGKLHGRVNSQTRLPTVIHEHFIGFFIFKDNSLVKESFSEKKFIVQLHLNVCNVNQC